MKDLKRRQDMPRVTILMPVYNAMPYLHDAVQSMLSQTFSSFVLLALDDGSTDGSVAYLNSVKDPRVRVLSGGGHMGLGAILNQGIALAGTEYIARMDGDDICTPERLEKQVTFLDGHPRVGAVGTQFTYLGTEGRTGFGRVLPLGHEDIMHGLRRGELSVVHASLMLRTDVVRGIGGYRFAGVGEDWDMFLRLGEVSCFANLPEVMYLYRVHDANASWRKRHLTLRRIRFACECAQARLAGTAEPDEAQFIRDFENGSALEKGLVWLDGVSLGRYARGRNQVLHGVRLLGYANLAMSAALSPRRLAARLNPARWRSHKTAGDVAVPREGLGHNAEPCAIRE